MLVNFTEAVTTGLTEPLFEQCAEGEHHWHLGSFQSRGCCRCPAVLRKGRDAPPGAGECAQPVGPLDELMSWLSDLAPEDPRPLDGLRRRLRRRTPA